MALLTHRDHEDRPWGSFLRFTLNEASTVKMVYVKPGQRLSLQKHAKRNEFWHVLTGSGSAQVGDEEKEAKAGSEFEIPAGTLHRLTSGPEGIWVLEIAVGDFDENDIVRVEDDFGRAAPTSQSSG
jgi:mannose-6-phosphate isomerase-like protein (cupin superfamily)